MSPFHRVRPPPNAGLQPLAGPAVRNRKDSPREFRYMQL
jgi:hypothetical protein